MTSQMSLRTETDTGLRARGPRGGLHFQDRGPAIPNLTRTEPQFALSLTLPGEAAGGLAPDDQVLVDEEFPSHLDGMARFLEAASSRLPDKVAFVVRLCLEELIVNVITHGLGNDSTHGIRVRVAITGSWLEIRLKDDAPAFDPFTRAPEPGLTLGVDERSVGGLGIHFVKQTMDQYQWHYVGKGNLIVLRKHLVSATRDSLQR
jgi:serine/threonine-protein kinase RsbW